MNSEPCTMPSDAGLFGPGSVTWRVHDDPSMLLAGFRALLLEGLHPLVLEGFAANSVFEDDPWGRLQRTGRWISTVTYGSAMEAQAAGAQLRRIHANLEPIVDHRTGHKFRVDDPDLLKWVHCTEVESFLSTFRRSGGHLDPGDGDRYVDEMRASGQLVGLNPATLPATEAQIQDYYRQVRPELEVTALTRRLAVWGFFPPMPRWVALATPARPAWAGLITVAAGMLPPWARRMYGFPGLPTTDIAASISGKAVRQAITALPARLVRPPAQREFRERLQV